MPGDQQKMIPHGLRVVVVVLVGVVVGRRVVVVVGRAVVVDVTVAVVVVVVAVVVVLGALLPPADEEAVVVVVVAPDDPERDDDVAPVAATVRPGCSLPLTTTIPPLCVGSSPRGSLVVLPCAARRAATAAPTRAPKASRPEPPNAVSIHNDYRPHSVGSNHSGQLVPA
ncbi:hypothetical protein ACIGNX_15945 [Actinosynnema sp. NPDC053489]|uniref:hypothetical protein n=1 Tax=Actinosynnema sp. NPDC053489 TaxID=3363916 RepID=UPI0037C7DE54